MISSDEEEYNNASSSLSPTLFKLSGVDTTAGDAFLEETLSEILGLKTTLLEKDYNDQKGTILFCCHGDDDSNPDQLDSHVLTTIGGILQAPINSYPKFWCQSIEAAISIVDEEDEDDECVEYITEEEAYQLWLEQNQADENDSDDLSDLVSSPDGHLVRPKHHAHHLKDDNATELVPSGMATCTSKQLERDTGLFDFDNVERVHYTKVFEFLLEKDSSNKDSQIDSWKTDFGSKPIVITGGLQHEDLVEFQKTLQESIKEHGADTIVRTGNRETLVENGFHNSRAASLSQVVDSSMLQPNGATKTPNQTIVFNPIHEMPTIFRSENVLGRWINENYCTTNNEKQLFPNTLWNTMLQNTDTANENPATPKFTLCIANEGFGIGMHKHGPALFFLTQGTKKWYLSHPSPIDSRIEAHTASDTSPTHPQFYRELSSHKCIQSAGELLLVPNLWYHEIYNLATPTIGIQALADELPIPGTLWVTEKQNVKQTIDT